MRVLLTNNTLAEAAESGLYVRDIAIELMRHGHQPVAYSTRLGAVAEELRRATVPVIDRLSNLADPPDIIHGQHHHETLTALLRFPDVPAVYVCQWWLPWEEATLQHPNIVRYVAVDPLCRERLVADGISPTEVEVIPHFFDRRNVAQRPTCELQPAVDQLIAVYEKATATGPKPGAQAGRSAADYLEHCVASERDHWIAKANAAEAKLAQRDQELREKQALLEDRQPLFDRCANAEKRLARYQEKLDELQSVMNDRQRWMDRCVAAEKALVRSQQSLPQEVAEQTARLHGEMKHREVEAARLTAELKAIRDSATWRWSQGVLQSQPIQTFFGPWIRSVAGLGHTNAASGPAVADAQSGRSTSELEGSVLDFSDAALESLQAKANRLIAEQGPMGVPGENFAQAGREQMVALLAEGLRPQSKVVEFGCGCLRIGYWLIRYLNPNSYCGIDAARQRVDSGLHYLLTPEEIGAKRPRFDYNPDYNSGVFNAKFDFFVARSIWGRATKMEIQSMLDSFQRDANPQATFLATYLPARSPQEDYQGPEWSGATHDPRAPEVIRHSLSWILGQCRNRGLTCAEIGSVDSDKQLWLRIRHGSAPLGPR